MGITDIHITYKYIQAYSCSCFVLLWPGSHLQSSGQARENNMDSEAFDEVCSI
jgi:hypothetical protein